MRIINLMLFLLINSALIFAQSAGVFYDTTSAPTSYAANLLIKSLTGSNYKINIKNPAYKIILNKPGKNLQPEAFAVKKEMETITISGGDETGVIYGALSVAEDIKNGVLLKDIQDKAESPLLPFRAIKYDLPWDTYRHSTSLYQHQEICADLKYWESFLDMMCANRFNVLTLWNLHPYTFLIKPQNFPEASPWSNEEMKQWKTLFTGIFKMAKVRGIDTYIMPFNIFVTPEFAKAHNVAMDNLEHHHYVNGDTSEIIKRYTRECVSQMLQEYPDLSGIGLTLGEAMGGMTPQQREDWMKETIIEGIKLSGRKCKLIHRIPFSGNTASLGATTIEMEQVTRKGIEHEAAMNFIDAPVWADLKFNWSHGHSTPKLIKVHGGKLYGTYWTPEPEGYKITWTVRNEDFFCLRWGASDFIKEHIKENTPHYVGGYMIGSETYIPAKDYFTKPGYSVPWKYAFERQWLFYKMWGRLLYNPETSDTVFINEFLRRYGKEGENLFKAYKLVSRTPLRLASTFDCGWDFTLYSEGFSALNPETKRVEYISADRLINQPPLDTNYISIADYVKMTPSDKIEASGKLTPPEIAAMLEEDCNAALKLLENVNPENSTGLLFETADIKAWANIGLHFAEKIKGCLALQTFRFTGEKKSRQAAIVHFKKALSYWDEVIKITVPLYNEMPLVHYTEQDGKSWKDNDHLRFHWKNLRDDVKGDIETAEKAN